MSHKLAFRPRNATLQQTHLRRDATPSSDSTKLGARGKKCFLIMKICSYCKYLQMFLFTRCNHCKEVDAMTKEMKVGRSWVPILEPRFSSSQISVKIYLYGHCVMKYMYYLSLFEDKLKHNNYLLSPKNQVHFS